MKIKPEHYEAIKNKFAESRIDSALIAVHRAYLQSPECLRKPRDLEKRLRWDLLSAAVPSIWVIANIYPYANDEHIDTALRQLISEIERTS